MSEAYHQGKIKNTKKKNGDKQIVEIIYHHYYYFLENALNYLFNVIAISKTFDLRHNSSHEFFPFRSYP